MEIVNGGLVPIQDSLASLDLQLANLDQGWAFLNSTFGPNTVKVAWQVGSQSHSSLSPTLYAAFGYTHAVLGGIGEDVREVLRAKQSLEFRWLGADWKGVYAHVLYAGYRFPPFLDPGKEGNCWKQGKISACASQLIAYSYSISQFYPSHNSLFIPYGDDLFWSDASDPIKVLKRTEAIMTHINTNQTHQIHIQWGTPSDYFHSAGQTAAPVLTYIGDFHPYMTHYVTSEYWTGLYSLQPSFKRKVYEAGELLRLATIWNTVVLDREIKAPGVLLCAHEEVLGGLKSKELRAAYRAVLDRGTRKTLENIHEATFGLLRNSSKSDLFPTPYRPVFLYNSLNWVVEALYRFETTHLSFRLLDHTGSQVTLQAIPTPGSSNFTVFFEAKLPSLSVNVWAIVEDCADCVPLAERKPGQRLSRQGKSWEVWFEPSGKVEKLQHSALGMVQLKQDFLAMGSARVDPYLFLPNYKGYADAIRQFPMFLQSFQLYEGPVFSAAVSLWLHNRQSLSQTVLFPAHSDSIIWEIASFALASEDLFLGLSLPLTSPNLTSMSTFDGYSWRERKAEAAKSGFDLGSNFYPILGAICLEKGLIIVPQTPIGVGTLPEAYLFHLQRSEKQGDFGLSKAQFTLTTKTAWPKAYYEAKTCNFLLNLNENGKMALDSPMNSPLFTFPWLRETQSRLGIESNDLFLASLSQKGGRKLLRIQPFQLDPTLTMDWEGVNIEEETDASGFHAVNTESWNKSEFLCIKNCFYEDKPALPAFLQSYIAQISSLPTYNRDEKSKNPKIAQNNSEKAGNRSETEAFLPTAESNGDLAALEYSLLLSLSVLVVLAVCCFLRTRKRRID